MKVPPWVTLLLLLAGCSLQHPPPIASTPVKFIDVPYPHAASPCPQDPPPPRPHLSDIAAHAACGRIGAEPFAVASAVVWQDGAGAFMSLRPAVPSSNGKYDPRA